MRYAVIKKVVERTGPNITSFGGKIIASGQVVDISDVIELENETWGRIANRERTYVCIQMGDDVHMSPLQALPDPDTLKKLITWAMIQGFKPNA